MLVLGIVPLPYESGAEGWTGNSMVQECWSIPGQRDKKAEKNKKPEYLGVLQTVKIQLIGPYIMTLTTFFPLCLELLKLCWD